jgi:hypothetical protein
MSLSDAMNLDVLTYAHAPNPLGIPAEWPAQVREVLDDTPPPAAPWVRMTREQYAAHRAEHQPAYEGWASAQEPPAPPPCRWSTLDFLLRFTAAERAAIRGSAVPEVQDFLDLLRAAGEVAADHPLTAQGMALLVALDLLTPERRDQILEA